MHALLAHVSHRSRHVAAVVLTVGVLALRTAFSQPEPSTASRDPLQETVARVEEIQSLEGLSSPALIEPLAALAVLYREQGNGDLALAAIERARRIARGTYGLYSLEEAPLLRQLLAAEKAAGNAEAAWEIEQDLLQLADKHRGSLQTVPILRDLGDSRLEILRRYVSGEKPREIVLGCFYGDPDEGNGCSAGSRSSATRRLLFETQFYYGRAAQTLLSHEGYGSAALPELWMKCVRTAYEFRDELTPWERFPEAHYRAGKSCLQQIAIHAGRNSQPLPAQMDAAVQIADWDLLFARGRDAKASILETYGRTYAAFEMQGVDPAAFTALFSPNEPVVLPTFLPSPLTSEEPAEPTGHVDVAFDITELGAGERVEILAATPNVPAATRKRIVELIEHSLFRPRAVGGRFETSRVVVRYFVGEDGG